MAERHLPKAALAASMTLFSSIAAPESVAEAERPVPVVEQAENSPVRIGLDAQAFRVGQLLISTSAVFNWLDETVVPPGFDRSLLEGPKEEVNFAEVSAQADTEATIQEFNAFVAAMEAERKAQQAKAAREASRAQAALAARTSAPVPEGDPRSWMEQAGIPEVEMPGYYELFRRESTWRPDVVNRKGCIGLGQACPGGFKSVLEANCPDWAVDPVCQIEQFRNYVTGRYGGIDAALSHHDEAGWY